MIIFYANAVDDVGILGSGKVCYRWWIDQVYT